MIPKFLDELRAFISEMCITYLAITQRVSARLLGKSTTTSTFEPALDWKDSFGSYIRRSFLPFNSACQGLYRLRGKDNAAV